MYKQKLSNGVKTKHLIIGSIIISFLIIGSAVLIGKVFAQEASGIENIQYPVKELGNCKDGAACKSYCDKTENASACLNFAEKNNLMPKEEIETAKKFVASGSKGPGACRGKNECEAYCNDINHIDECVAFAEKNNLMPEKDLAEAKQVQAAIKKGVKPPACGNKDQCEVYCSETAHMEECITFGAEAGFLQGKELEDSKKMLAALKRGVKLLPCNGKDACDAYCNSPDNMETCMNFAIEVGFMNDKEKADSQKMLQALKKGIKPPACKSKEECDTYCSQDAHFEECAKFAEAAGFMTAEEATMARKTGGKGPGGCKGKDECEAFCNNPDNQETCFNFGKENGMIPPEELKRMEEGKQKFQETLNQAPSSVLECLDSQIGASMMAKFKGGSAMPPKEIGDQMRNCFEKTMGPGEPGAGGMIPPAGQVGPGGCKTADECKSYCETHQEECQKTFQPGPGNMSPGDQVGPQQAGPGQFAPGDGSSGSGGGQQFAPGTSGFGIQPGQFSPPSSGNCQNPEGCQGQQQQMPNNMMAPPQPCQGENCAPAGPMGQPGGYQGVPESFLPPANQQPPINQQPQINNIAPPPAGEMTPPSGGVPPPPSGAIVPGSLPGLFLNAFLSILNR